MRLTRSVSTTVLSMAYSEDWLVAEMCDVFFYAFSWDLRAGVSPVHRVSVLRAGSCVGVHDGVELFCEGRFFMLLQFRACSCAQPHLINMQKSFQSADANE